MEQHTFCYRKLLLEHIDSPIDQKRLAIRSSYQRLLTLWSTNKLVVTGSSYQSSLTPRSIKTFFRSGALIRAHWLPDQPTNILGSKAIIRAYWLPDRSTNMLWSGALISAHCNPDRQTLNLFWLTKKIVCDWRLLSGLIEPLIDQKPLAIRCSYHRSSTPWSIKNILRSEALIRARWLPDQSKTSCDQKLSLELVDSLFDRQTCCDWELLSELINPHPPQKISDFP